jgi:hypothetical protein
MRDTALHGVAHGACTTAWSSTTTATFHTHHAGFTAWFKEEYGEAYVPLKGVKIDHLYIECDSCTRRWSKVSVVGVVCCFCCRGCTQPLSPM